MTNENTFTPESIYAMAEAAKELVADSTRWVLQLQNLPIEEAEAEYSRSPVEGDALVEQMQQARGDYYNQPSPSAGWEDDFIESTWGAALQLSSVASLLIKTFGFSQGSFWNDGLINHPMGISVLQNCAHAPDFRLMAESLVGMSFWKPEMSFRTGFEAASYFGNQVYHYQDRILGFDRISRDIESLTTYDHILNVCRSERKDAQGILRPCICVEQLQAIIDYEAAWLLHAFCGAPEPRQWSLPSPLWLTERADVKGATGSDLTNEGFANWAPRAAWWKEFSIAGVGKESWCKERVADWIKRGVMQVDASASERGKITFNREFLNQHNVKSPNG